MNAQLNIVYLDDMLDSTTPNEPAHSQARKPKTKKTISSARTNKTSTNNNEYVQSLEKNNLDLTSENMTLKNEVERLKLENAKLNQKVQQVEQNAQLYQNKIQELKSKLNAWSELAPKIVDKKYIDQLYYIKTNAASLLDCE